MDLLISSDLVSGPLGLCSFEDKPIPFKRSYHKQNLTITASETTMDIFNVNFEDKQIPAKTSF